MSVRTALQNIVSEQNTATVKNTVWEPVKTGFCQHARREVSLETALVFPAEWLPDQPPRILSHRCSNAVDCNLDERSSCMWSGTNPAYDPFTG